ncbi:MAG: hypothetical protein R3291_04100, partial [Thermoplasmata archaeon]|nr:hypothetical protein [Thermoplasmata archaeon]
MKLVVQALHLTAVLVLAAMLVPLPTASGEREVTALELWSQEFDGEGHVVVVDDANVYVGLRRSGEPFLVKYAADGQPLWTRYLGDLGGPLKVAVSASTLYVIGRSSRLLT